MSSDCSVVEVEYGANNADAFTLTLAQTMSRCLHTPPAHLPPLYDSIDPEVLYQLLESTDGAVVTFNYEGWEVTVSESLIRCTESTV